MGSQLEVMSATRQWRVSLESDRATIGKAGENDVALSDDPTASHLHAVLERFPAGWCVADLGSPNGTWLNGSRIWSSQRLRHGDEIRVGRTRLIFRATSSACPSTTRAAGSGWRTRRCGGERYPSAICEQPRRRRGCPSIRISGTRS